MTQLASQEEIQTALKHLKQRKNSVNSLGLASLASYLEANQLTLSDEFNTYLVSLVEAYQKPQQPEAISEFRKRNLKLAKVLDEICNQPEISLNYQGVNLATAINMKLAVNLAALIKEEKHV